MRRDYRVSAVSIAHDLDECPILMVAQQMHLGSGVRVTACAVS